jgi:sortase A
MTDKIESTERPATRDWRFWVGGTGRVLLAIGVLMFGFLAYQLWGTGIEFHQHQQALASQFVARRAALSAGSSTSTTTAPATGPSATSSTTQPRAPIAWPAVSNGQVLAEVDIPRIHKHVYAVAGVGLDDLRKGLGHYPGTPLPGQLGNAAFAGHRTTYGAPLFDIDQLGPGDQIIVTTITNERYVYVVRQRPQVVAPDDVAVVATTDRRHATLTLTSCNPKYSAKQRIVAVADLDPSRSGPVEAVASPVTTSPSGPGGVTSGPVASPSTVSEIVGTPTSSISRGWFADQGAWWPVAGWGSSAAALVVAAWSIGRRWSKRWLTLLIAVVPFLVLLYFVYENVSRLLPADL